MRAILPLMDGINELPDDEARGRSKSLLADYWCWWCSPRNLGRCGDLGIERKLKCTQKKRQRWEVCPWRMPGEGGKVKQLRQRQELFGSNAAQMWMLYFIVEKPTVPFRFCVSSLPNWWTSPKDDYPAKRSPPSLVESVTEHLDLNDGMKKPTDFLFAWLFLGERQRTFH